MPCEHRILVESKYMGVQQDAKCIQDKQAMPKTGKEWQCQLQGTMLSNQMKAYFEVRKKAVEF